MTEVKNFIPTSVDLSFSQIFVKIWLSPRILFRYLSESGYSKHVEILLILAGIVRAFDRAFEKNLGDQWPLTMIVVICMGAGALGGWISVYIYAYLLRWTGQWLDGKARAKDIIRIFAYGMIPMIVTLVFIAVQIVLFGNEIFQSSFDIYVYDTFHIAIFWFTILGELIFGVWCLILLIIGLAEVQNMSTGKAILNLFLPLLVILIPLGVIAFILGDMFG